MGMVVWGASGAIAFLIQGWPQYKWSLFTVPVGILAVVGVEALVTTTARLGLRRAGDSSAMVGSGLAVLSFLVGASARMQTHLLIGVAVGICCRVRGGHGMVRSSTARGSMAVARPRGVTRRLRSG